MKIGLIAYNFKHRKTQDFIFRLLAEGFNIEVIFAADKKELSIPSSSIRKSVRFTGLLHPSEIARQFDIPFEVVDHDDEERMTKLIEDYDLDVGVISGARILKPFVINSFKGGIINFHPGLIPQARGLDAILWSVLKGHPLGVTSHLIDERIDAGKILCKEKINLDEDDTIFDLYEKVYSLQLNLIKSSIEVLREGKGKVLADAGSYYSKMDTKQEQEVMQKIPDYIRNQLSEEG